MRILHCTDFHAKENWYDWLIRESVNFGLVCLTGDLLDLNPYRPLAGQIDRVSSLLRRIPVPLALCSGNHDSLAGEGPSWEHARWLQELRGEKVWVDGDRFEMDGYKFRCIPWLSGEVAATAEEIWLIHAPPDRARTAITRGGKDWGDFTFGEQCRAGEGPWLALSGHIHEPQAWRAQVGRTWSLNPGCAEQADEPNHLFIDLLEGVVVRHQASGETDAMALEPCSGEEFS